MSAGIFRCTCGRDFKTHAARANHIHALIQPWTCDCPAPQPTPLGDCASCKRLIRSEGEAFVAARRAARATEVLA